MYIYYKELTTSEDLILRSPNLESELCSKIAFGCCKNCGMPIISCAVAAKEDDPTCNLNIAATVQHEMKSKHINNCPKCGRKLGSSGYYTYDLPDFQKE